MFLDELRMPIIAFATTQFGEDNIDPRFRSALFYINDADVLYSGFQENENIRLARMLRNLDENQKAATKDCWFIVMSAILSISLSCY